MDGKTYAYAVVARKDQPGLVLCYEDVTGYKEVDNELSLDTLLSGNNFTMEATIIITDGASIINSNDETKKNKTISGTVVETAEKQGWDDNTVQKIKSDGQTWYVMRRGYKDNHLYVFYTSGEVFTYRTTTMAYAVLLYLLFVSFFHMIHYRYARKNTEYIEKQYQTIQAISTIYSTDIILFPQTNTWEGLKIPESVGVHLHGGETMGELVETQAAAAGVTFHRERAGGTISFTSEEGVGTTFTIEFRFLLAPETEKGDNSKDNTMQDFQGTQQIRAMHRPDAATIPIIAMTANAFADDIQQSKEAGMSEHLSKPLDEQKMFAMIRKYCREKKEGENQ